MKKSPITVAGTLLLVSAAGNLAVANQINASAALNGASLGNGESESKVNNFMIENSAVPTSANTSTSPVTFIPPGAYVAEAHDRPDTIGDLSGLGDEKGWGKFLDGNSDNAAVPGISTENSPAAAAAVVVPEGGTTALLVGVGILGMTAAVRRRKTTA